MVNGTMMGTDFSYEDFARLQGMIGSLDATRAPDEQLAGRAVFITESTPSAADSEYARIRSLVDQQTCVPLRVEFFHKGVAEPAKVLSVDPAKLAEVKTGWMPREIRAQQAATAAATGTPVTTPPATTGR